jgi:hypothetical protein
MKREHANECAVCLESMQKAVYINCGHFFCEQCINQCDKCPVCRQQKFVKTSDKTNLFEKSLSEDSIVALCCSRCKQLDTSPFIVETKDVPHAFMCRSCVSQTQMLRFELAHTAEPRFFKECFDTVGISCPNQCGWFGSFDTHAHHVENKCEYQKKFCAVCNAFVIQKDFQEHLDSCVVQNVKVFQPHLVLQLLAAQQTISSSVELHICKLIVTFLFQNPNAASFLKELKACLQYLPNSRDYITTQLERVFYAARFELDYDHRAQLAKFWTVVAPLLQTPRKLLALLTCEHAIYGQTKGTMQLHVVRKNGMCSEMKVPPSVDEIQQSITAYESIRHGYLSWHKKLKLACFQGQAQVDIALLDGTQTIVCSSAQMAMLLQLDGRCMTLVKLLEAIFPNHQQLSTLQRQQFYSHLLGLLERPRNLVQRSCPDMTRFDLDATETFSLNLTLHSQPDVQKVPVVGYNFAEPKFANGEKHFLESRMCCILMSRSGVRLSIFYAEVLFQVSEFYCARFSKKLQLSTVKEMLSLMVERAYAEIKNKCVFYV